MENGKFDKSFSPGKFRLRLRSFVFISGATSAWAAPILSLEYLLDGMADWKVSWVKELDTATELSDSNLGLILVSDCALVLVTWDVSPSIFVTSAPDDE